MVAERLEQNEFERRHRHFVALLVGEPVCGAIEHATPHAYALGAHLSTESGRRAAQNTFHACQQLTWVERLGYIVIRADLQSNDRTNDGARGSRDDDRLRGIAVAHETRKGG